jgi:hypothetical protein
MNFVVQVTQVQISFVLTWGQSPRDLDSHLVTPSIDGNVYHVYYSNRGNVTFTPFAKPDVDKTQSYGPENMSIYQLFTVTYHYYVLNNSGEAPIAGSGAQVNIYGPSGNLLDTINAPGSETGSGLYWLVADVDGATGNVTVVNQIATAPPTGG